MMYEPVLPFHIKQSDMNTLFNDNANAKYSTKDLKGGYRQQHLFIAESTLR